MKWLQLVYYGCPDAKRSMGCIYGDSFGFALKQLTDEEGIVDDVAICPHWRVPGHYDLLRTVGLQFWRLHS